MVKARSTGGAGAFLTNHNLVASFSYLLAETLGLIRWHGDRADEDVVFADANGDHNQPPLFLSHLMSHLTAEVPDFSVFGGIALNNLDNVIGVEVAWAFDFHPSHGVNEYLAPRGAIVAEFRQFFPRLKVESARIFLNYDCSRSHKFPPQNHVLLIGTPVVKL